MKVSQSTNTLGNLIEKWTGQGGRSGAEDSTFQRFRSQLAQATEEPGLAGTADRSTLAGPGPVLETSLTGTTVLNWRTRTERTPPALQEGAAPFPAASVTKAPVSENLSRASAPPQTEKTAYSAAEKTADTQRASFVTQAKAPEEPLEVTPAVPWFVTFRDRSQWSADLAQAAKEAVKVELAKAGIDPSKVKMAYWEEVVWYPGGNFILKNITVQTPNGEKCDFDAAATVRSPDVTARDVLHMLEA